MDYSQDYSNNSLEHTKYYLDSIPRITKDEESTLWRQYIKWRYIKSILDSEGVHCDMPEASPIVFSRIIEKTSASHDLIVLLRRHLGLNKLGDTIVAAENSTNIAIELYRLIQYSEKKHNENVKQDDSDTCRLEDLFGYILGETLNNIAFSRGNPNLVGKIAKVINRERTYIKDKFFELAVNRELLPRGLLNLFDSKTPFNELPNLIRTINPDVFQFVYDDYRLFISNVKSEGKKAFRRIIESHLWLVLDIVKKYVNNNLDLPSDDLMQEGNLGLVEAAEGFQPTLSRKFMEYAYPRICQKINQMIADETYTIRISDYEVEAVNQLLVVKDHLTEEYGREPTYTEIAEEMDMSLDKVRKLFKFSKLPTLPRAPIGNGEDSALSEDENDTMGEEEDSSLVNFITDGNALSPIDAIDKQLLKEQIGQLLSTLTPQQQRILQLRFGLEDGRSRTLEEVGQEFNVTRERIRQIQDKALGRLRHPSRSRKLKDFL